MKFLWKIENVLFTFPYHPINIDETSRPYIITWKVIPNRSWPQTEMLSLDQQVDWPYNHKEANRILNFSTCRRYPILTSFFSPIGTNFILEFRIRTFFLDSRTSKNILTADRDKIEEREKPCQKIAMNEEKGKKKSLKRDRNTKKKKERIHSYAFAAPPFLFIKVRRGGTRESKWWKGGIKINKIEIEKSIFLKISVSITHVDCASKLTLKPTRRRAENPFHKAGIQIFYCLSDLRRIPFRWRWNIVSKFKFLKKCINF